MSSAVLTEIADKFLIAEAVSDFYLKLDLFDWQGVKNRLDANLALAISPDEPDVPLVSQADFMTNLIARNGGYGLGEAGTFHGDCHWVVELNGDDARAYAKYMAAHFLSPADEDYSVMTGVYIVDVKRRTDGWKIRRIWLKPIHVRGDVGRIVETAARNWQARERK